MTAQGKEAILALRGPGDVVGELGAITRSARSSAVRALEPVETLAIGAPEFRQFLDTHARASMNLVLVLIERLQSSDNGRVEYAAHDVVGRVACRLIELCERFGQPAAGAGGAIEVAFSQEELAAWTASSREAIAKAMRLLRELGWIETHRRRIVVRDLEAPLRRLTCARVGTRVRRRRDGARAMRRCRIGTASAGLRRRCRTAAFTRRGARILGRVARERGR